MTDFNSKYAPAFIYVMKNSGFAQLKVGHTTRSVYERAQELGSGTGVPGKFTVLEHWYVPKDSVKILERRIHILLKARGKYFKKEFFNATLDEVHKAIVDVLAERNIAAISFRTGDSENQKLEEFEKSLAERSMEFRRIREHDLREKLNRERAAAAKARKVEILGEFDRLYWRSLHQNNKILLIFIPRLFSVVRIVITIAIFISSIAFVANNQPPRDWGRWVFVLFFAYILAYGGWDFLGSLEDKWHIGMLERLKRESNFERKKLTVVSDIERGLLTDKTREQLVEALTKYCL